MDVGKINAIRKEFPGMVEVVHTLREGNSLMDFF